MIKRVLLLLGYWLLALGNTFLFAGSGHGSYFPFCVLVSWPGFFSRLMNHPRDNNIPVDPLAGLLLLIFYYAGLMAFVSKLARAPIKSLRFLPGAIHLGGVLALVLIIDKASVIPESKWSTGFFIMSYLVSLVLVLLWLGIDWLFAREGRMKEHQTALGQE